MRIHRLETTSAFIVFDLDAPTSVGITRLAPKVLVDGAELLARTTTYAFATFGLEIGGGSAGIDAPAEQRDDAVAAYVSEVAPLSADLRWLTGPGVGLNEGDLVPLRINDPRPPALWQDGLEAELRWRGALAAAEAVLGEVAGTTAVISGSEPALAAALTERGAVVAEEGECDVLFAGGRVGSIDHEAALGLRAKAVVPIAPVPVTAKAFAVFSRAGTVVVPDFVSTAAPLLHAFASTEGDPVERVRAMTAELAAEGVGAWMAAARRAEEFLLTWQDVLPFGRPLA